MQNGNTVTGRVHGIQDHYIPVRDDVTGNLIWRVADKVRLLGEQSNGDPPIPAKAGPQWDITQRFDFLGKLVSMVITGISPSCVVAGEGGLGKSYAILELLNASGLIDGIGYVLMANRGVSREWHEDKAHLGLILRAVSVWRGAHFFTRFGK
jgi:hypothetical protein